MASNTAEGRVEAPPGDMLLSLIAADGVGSHRLWTDDTVFSGPDGTRNIADVLHFLCMLHGRHPGLIDLAIEATTCATSRSWLIDIAPAFMAERLYATRLAVAVGPVPSTPGSAECEAAVVGQYHALQMLARSERRGCPLGAAVALIMDWWAFRPLLDHAANRLGVDPVLCILPDARSIGATVNEVGDDPSVWRALGFGASQVLVQHRGLFDLLEARRSARRDS